MSFWNNCCCKSGGCQIFKGDWDGNGANTFEVSNMVASAKTVLRKITSDGSTLAYQDYDKQPAGWVRTSTTARQSPCLEVETSINWRPSPGDFFQSFYMFGQTYDDLEFVPTGQNYRWGGSIDYSLRYLERRVNLSTTNTGVLSAYADAAATPPAGRFDLFKLVTVWLAARQNGVTYVKRWNADQPGQGPGGSPAAFVVEGVSGHGYPLPVYSPSWITLETGDWLRFGSYLSNPGFFMGSHVNPYNHGDYRTSPHAWLKPQSLEGPGKYNGEGIPESVLPRAELDWCGGAAPIYFGWAVSLAGTQHSNAGPPVYNVETLSKQTIRIDRICLTIKEDPTPACPCFDSCFQFDWPGGSRSFSNDIDTTIRTQAAAAVHCFLPRIGWNASTATNNSDFFEIGGGWCLFGDDVWPYGNVSAADFHAWLYVHKATGRAMIRTLCQKAETWYAAVGFTYTGATFYKTGLADPGGLQALHDLLHWSTLADLNDAGNYWQLNTSHIVDDTMPGEFDLTAIRCDGQLMGKDVAAGSCVGACAYLPDLVSPGVYRWKYAGDPSVNPCETECRCFETLYPPSTKYGVPSGPLDRLYLNCVPRSNHAPKGTPATVSIARNHSYTLAAVDFGFTDADDTPPDSLLAVIITTLPGRGSLRLSGDLLSPGKVIALHDLDEGNLVFKPDADTFASPYAVFTFQVIDNGGTNRGGIDTDSIPKTFFFNVT